MQEISSQPLQQQDDLEAAIGREVYRFQMEFMAGSFAECIHVLTAPDMIVVRSQSALPTAEQHLIRTEDGRALVKQVYRTLFAQQSRILASKVATLTGMAVTDVLTDFAVSTGEQVIVLLLASHHES
jgi:uncharacterized protein YbcI